MAIAQAINSPPIQNDPLSFYTQSTFLQYVYSVFRLHGPTIVDVTLEKVEDTLPATVSKTGGRESFILFFRGGTRELSQDTYTVDHPALGTFQLFLVPGGPDQYGAQSYTATVNRLAFTATPEKAPRKSTGTKSTGTKRPQATPAGQPVDSPEAQPAPPAQTLKPEKPVKQPKKKTTPDRFGNIGPGKDD
ncbi:MAG: hypothetical protein ABR607_16935 [Pyrinomonadaceae bacterium]